MSRQTRKEKKDEEEAKRQRRADLRQQLLDDDDAFLKTVIIYKQMKTGVTDSEGRLTVTSLKANHVYKVFDVYTLKELSSLIQNNLVDAKDLVI